MEIDEVLVQIKVQNLHIARWTVIKKKQLPKSTWVLKKKNLQ
jgi:hypothetical protein